MIDRDAGRLVWAAPGRNSETLGGFFDTLGPEDPASSPMSPRTGAEWIHSLVAERAPTGGAVP